MFQLFLSVKVNGVQNNTEPKWLSFFFGRKNTEHCVSQNKGSQTGLELFLTIPLHTEVMSDYSSPAHYF